MRQRAMIAMAIANDPTILIADEPTTALDVTIQAQIVEVMRAAQEETHAATILITHDLGLIAELADRVVVMYAGRVVELGDVFTIFNSPRHPYTVGLMSSLARLDADLDRLSPIPGQPPSLVTRPPGCAFHPRCAQSAGRAPCRTDVPELRSVGEGATISPPATSQRSSRPLGVGAGFAHRRGDHERDVDRGPGRSRLWPRAPRPTTTTSSASRVSSSTSRSRPGS